MSHELWVMSYIVTGKLEKGYNNQKNKIPGIPPIGAKLVVLGSANNTHSVLEGISDWLYWMLPLCRPRVLSYIAVAQRLTRIAVWKSYCAPNSYVSPPGSDIYDSNGMAIYFLGPYWNACLPCSSAPRSGAFPENPSVIFGNTHPASIARLPAFKRKSIPLSG